MKQDNLNPGELPEGITVVKFSIKNCGPCSMLAPLYEALDYGDKVNLLAIDPQENIDWMAELSIRSAPTTVGFVDNKPVFTVKGASIDKIKSEIEKLL